MSGSGISWAIRKSAPRSRQITTPAPHHSVFYRPDALPAAQPTASKHWRQSYMYMCWNILSRVLPSVLTLLVGQQVGCPACKNWVVGCWCGYLSGARCRLAYGPADNCHSPFLASVKSRLFLPFGYRLTRVVQDIGLLYGCVYVFSLELLTLPA